MQGGPVPRDLLEGENEDGGDSCREQRESRFLIRLVKISKAQAGDDAPPPLGEPLFRAEDLPQKSQEKEDRGASPKEPFDGRVRPCDRAGAGQPDQANQAAGCEQAEQEYPEHDRPLHKRAFRRAPARLGRVIATRRADDIRMDFAQGGTACLASVNL